MNLKTIAFLSVSLLALASCQVNSQMNLAVDQSGQVSGTIAIDRGFSAYYSELLKTIGVTDTFEAGDIFQEKSIREVMNSYSKVKLTKLEKTSPSVLEGRFTFDPAHTIMADTPKVAGKPVLEIKNLGKGTQELSFHVNRGNVKQVLSMSSGIAEDPTASTFLPSESNPILEEEYRELVQYMLEKNVPNVMSLFDSSYVAMDVTFPRPIKSLKGDATYSGSVVKLKFPMVRLLSLENPIDVVVVY